MTQSEFAAAVRTAGEAMGMPNQCTRRLVQKWENGEHNTCRPGYMRILELLTRHTAQELGLLELSDGEDDSELEGFKLAEYDSEAIAMLRYAVEHPSTVNSRTAELVESATERLFDLEHHCRAKLIAPTVERHLTTVTSLLTAARHLDVRRRLLLAAGQASALAGWLALDRDDIYDAHNFLASAIGVAEIEMNDPLFVCGMIYLTYTAERSADEATAWQLAHTASSHARADTRAASWATARAALHAARLKDHDSALANLDTSLELGATLPAPFPGDACEPWARFFDQACLFSSAALTAGLISDRRTSDFAAEAVARLGPSKVKARAIVLAEAALAAALVSEFDQCLDYGGPAVGLALEMDSSIALATLRRLTSELLRYSNARPVRELLPQLRRIQQRDARLTV